MQQKGSFTARRRARIRSSERPRGRGQLRAAHSINTACYLESQLCSERILDVTFVSRDQLVITSVGGQPPGGQLGGGLWRLHAMKKWPEDLSLFPHLYIVRIRRQKSWEPILGCWPVQGEFRYRRWKVARPGTDRRGAASAHRILQHLLR